MRECIESTYDCPRVIEKLTMSLSLVMGKGIRTFVCFSLEYFKSKVSRINYQNLEKHISGICSKTSLEKKTYKINAL